MARYQEQEAMPIPLENLKNKEDWDEFFTREADKSIEWCAVGQHFDLMLIDNLLWKLSDLAKSPEKRQPEKKRAEVRILVPGCGNSILSERLYDAGFVNIMNVDPSKVVIERMMRKNWRERPEMKWRYMDITCLQQFEKDSFDVVVDKGGLDVLMEGSFGPRLGNLYLSEVKRVVSHGGKYITITRASSHTIDLLLNKFRFGWRWSISPIARPKMHIFMLVMEKDLPTRMNLFTAFIEYADKSPGFKASKIFKALQKEIKICDGYHYEKNIMYTLEDLRLGARGDISVLEPGRRITVILGEPGVSRFSYYGVLLDAMPDLREFEHQYAVIIIPQVLKRDTNYTKEEGQWSVSSSSKAYRSLLTDLTPLVKQLAPALHGNPACTPIFRRYNGITRREIVYEVMSDLTGPIVVEDVIYTNNTDVDPRKDCKYSRLIFKRAESLVQSEAPISKKGSVETESETKHEARGETDKEKRQEAAVETEKEAKQDAKANREARVEIEKEARQEAPFETEVEVELEAPVVTDTEAKKVASVEIQKEEKHDAPVETKKEEKHEALVATEKEANKNASVETKKDTKQEASVKIEKEARQEALVDTDEEEKKEASVRTKKRAKRKKSVKAKKGAKQEASVKTKEDTSIAAVKEASEALLIKKGSVETEQDAFSSIETEREEKQEASIGKEKEAMQEAQVEKEVEAKLEAEIEEKKVSSVESEIEAKQEAPVETKKEENHEPPVETKKEEKHEEPVATRKEAKKDESVETKKEDKQEASVKTKKVAKQRKSAKAKRGAKQEAAVEKEKKAKQDMLVETEKEAKQGAAVETEKEAKQEALVEIDKEASREAPVEIEEEARQESSTETMIDAKKGDLEIVPLPLKKRMVTSKSAFLKVGNICCPLVETKKEEKQEASVETEKEAKQET